MVWYPEQKRRHGLISGLGDCVCYRISVLTCRLFSLITLLSAFDLFTGCLWAVFTETRLRRRPACGLRPICPGLSARRGPLCGRSAQLAGASRLDRPSLSPFVFGDLVWQAAELRFFPLFRPLRGPIQSGGVPLARLISAMSFPQAQTPCHS